MFYVKLHIIMRACMSEVNVEYSKKKYRQTLQQDKLISKLSSINFNKYRQGINSGQCASSICVPVDI